MCKACRSGFTLNSTKTACVADIKCSVGDAGNPVVGQSSCPTTDGKCKGGNSADPSKSGQNCSNYDGKCKADTVDTQCCKPTDEVRCKNGGAGGDAVQSQWVNWSVMVGNCRYANGYYTSYRTLKGQQSLQLCKDNCTTDPRCHAIDVDAPFKGRCDLYSDKNSQHTGDGVSSARCWRHERATGQAAGLACAKAATATTHCPQTTNARTMTTTEFATRAPSTSTVASLAQSSVRTVVEMEVR